MFANADQYMGPKQEDEVGRCVVTRSWNMSQGVSGSGGGHNYLFRRVTLAQTRAKQLPCLRICANRFEAIELLWTEALKCRLLATIRFDPRKCQLLATVRFDPRKYRPGPRSPGSISKPLLRIASCKGAPLHNGTRTPNQGPDRTSSV